MIVFDLKCPKDHVFEGWFADSAAYEAQVAAGEVECPVCGSVKVGKALMAPNVATRSSSAKGNEMASGNDTVPLAKQKEEAGKVMAMMRAVKDHVEKNFKNVGPKFAEEAKKIHYGEAEKRNIYGKATREEAKELHDEGVDFGELPDVPEFDG
jgi:hypothetical protein